MPLCICGCEEETKGGKFRPGHDQKLRVSIEDAVGGLEALKIIAEDKIGKPISTK